MKIICVEFENLNHFNGGRLKIDFFTTDRVFSKSELYKISNCVVTQNIIGFIGLNATGKTSVLRLLKIALSVVIYNTPLNLLNINDMVFDGTILRITFLHKEISYQLESIIGCDKSRRFYYKEEILREKPLNKIKSRKNLIDFISCSEQKRSALREDIIKYLDDDKSIINPTVKGNNSYVSDNLLSNYMNIAFTSGETPSPILEIFDESIETLLVENSSGANKWKLKFKDSASIYSAPELITLNFIISTGTISGQELLQKTILALKHGGYLIVDELEMHLNKEIIAVILNLFKTRKTNPNGACLIFSTHYPELLDKIDRKDNVYITRKKNHLLSVSKFSDEFKRNDFKKSEIILSNALTGTAPKYEAIQRLRDYICSQL